VTRTPLCARDVLAATMSKYLIRRIEENAAIVVRTQTEIVGLEGRAHLERVRWRDNRTVAQKRLTSHTYL
jgi:thioredoxin reductase (NADPH)